MMKKEIFNAIEDGLRSSYVIRKRIMAGFSRNGEAPRLNSTHYRALLYLFRSGPSCMHDVGRQIGLEAGSFTPVADRLIEEGFVERLADPEDRRRLLLRLTDFGEKRVVIIIEKIRNRAEEELSVLGDDLLSELASAMTVISRACRELERND